MNHSLRSMLTGLGSLAGIALIVFGLPFLLLAVGHPPDPSRWSIQALGHALTRPDDGTVFLSTLTVVAWSCWLIFGALIALEVHAQVRQRPVLRLPGLGWAQTLTAGLVSTVVVGLSSQAAMAGSSPEISPVEVAQEQGDRPDQQQHERESEAEQQEEEGAAVYEVQDGDTYWGIAQDQLGAGERYSEIVSANEGRVMHDGSVLTGDEFPHPGWELTLPVATSDSPSAPESTEPESVHTVQAGDTLSHLAQQHLDDANAYTELFEANEGREQDRGGPLSDPDTIQPGWELLLPEETAQPQEPQEDAQPNTEDDQEQENSAAPDDEGEASADPPQGVDESTHSESDEEHTQPDASHSHDDEVALDATLSSDDSGIVATAAPWLGLSALAAAGVGGILFRRRKVQQRNRRPGHRIAQSQDDQVQETEADVHARTDPASVDLLDRALRSLSAKCASTRTPLPRIVAAKLHEDAELVVAEDQGIPITPFRRVDAHTWRLETNSAALLDEETARQIPAPYPGLTTLGHDDQQTQILVDLPQAGAIGLSGQQESVAEVLTSLAVELSTSPAADHLNLTCIGDFAPELAQLVKTQRVRSFETVDACLKELELQTLEYASTSGDEEVAPEVMLSSRPVTGEELARLSRILGSDAAPPIALVARETEHHQLPGPWHLQVEGAQPLPGLDVQVNLQRLNQSSYADIQALLRTAEVQTSVPAPGWEQVPAEPDLVGAATKSGFEPVSALMDLSAPGPASTSTPTVERPQPLTEYEVQLQVLGPVTLTGPDNSTLETGRQRALTELAAYLALRPRRTPEQISRAMGGPRGAWTASTRSAHLSKLRAWLGRDSPGAPHFPRQQNGTYSLAPTVGCDWHLFQELARSGLAEDTQRATTLLEEALNLVDGEPLSGVGLDRYGWAEPLKPEMHSSIVDVAHTIACRHLRDGFLEAARSALIRVLEIDPACELLSRDLVRVEYRSGNPEGITRTVQRLQIALDQLDLEMSEETEELLSQVATKKKS